MNNKKTKNQLNNQPNNQISDQLKNHLNNPNINWQYIAIVAFLAFIAVAGLFIYQSKQKDIDIPIVEIPEKKDEFAGWKTYTNEEYGFEVSYPKGYIVKEQNYTYDFMEGSCAQLFQVGITNPLLPKRLYDCCYTEEEIEEFGKIPAVEISVRISDCDYKGDESLLEAKVIEMLQKMNQAGIEDNLAISTMSLFPRTLLDGQATWSERCENYRLLKVKDNYFVKGTQCYVMGAVPQVLTISLPKNGQIWEARVVESEYTQSGVFDQILSTFRFIE
ncbi:MAG: hypothetical protein ISS87_00115 [Candidatus Pacebacteria bacterium]|nr:hypothetical protein [Candidatus Paceibacterota bacterium]